MDHIPVFSHRQFDHSFIIIRSNNWESYIPFLISSLNITSVEDIAKINGIKDVASDIEWIVYDFLIDYDNNNSFTSGVKQNDSARTIYTDSFIKLSFLFSKEDQQYLISFVRMRKSYASAEDRIRNQSHDLDLQSSLEFALYVKTIKDAGKSLINNMNK